MLHLRNKFHYLALGAKPATARRSVITLLRLFKQRHFGTGAISPPTKELERGRPSDLPPLPVTIAGNKASAAEDHGRITSQQKPPLAIYADGSDTIGGLGAAAIAPTEGKYSQAHLDPHQRSKIQTAELMGIGMAIDMAKKIKAPETAIFSDSQSALEVLQGGKLNRNCHFPSAVKKSMHEAHQAGRGVQFHWVPAHKGIVGNEIANSLAKDAATSGT